MKKVKNDWFKSKQKEKMMQQIFFRTSPQESEIDVFALKSGTFMTLSKLKNAKCNLYKRFLPIYSFLPRTLTHCHG